MRIEQCVVATCEHTQLRQGSCAVLFRYSGAHSPRPQAVAKPAGMHRFATDLALPPSSNARACLPAAHPISDHHPQHPREQIAPRRQQPTANQPCRNPRLQVQLQRETRGLPRAPRRLRRRGSFEPNTGVAAIDQRFWRANACGAAGDTWLPPQPTWWPPTRAAFAWRPFTRIRIDCMAAFRLLNLHGDRLLGLFPVGFLKGVEQLCCCV